MRLVAQEEERREEEAASLGKGKGKRLGSDDGEDDGVGIGVSDSRVGSVISLSVRQRKDSVMTTDDDVLGGESLDVPVVVGRALNSTDDASALT